MCTASNSRTVINIGNCSNAILGGKLHALFLVKFTDNARFKKYTVRRNMNSLLVSPKVVEDYRHDR